LDPDSGAYYRCGIFLWRNVIRRALMEAEGEVITVELSWAQRRESQREQQRLRAAQALAVKDEARMWLTIDTIDLRLAFHFAQLPGTYVEFLKVMRDRLGYVVN
jgi:hypothetical protein